MSILGNSKKLTAAVDTPALNPEQVVEQLRTLRAQIPEFVQPNHRALERMKRLASVNIELAREAVNAVDASEVVQSAIGNTPEEFHQANDDIARWTAVETELRAMLRGVIAANLVRRQRVGQAALQVLKVCRSLVQQEDHAYLLPHVEAMSRLPKFTRRRKPAAQKEPEQQPKAA